jgi:hypothetical protein
MSETRSSRFSCCTPRVCGYYFAVFTILFGADMLLLELWEGAGKYINALLFASLGIACIVNVARNRTLHCLITGPFFLLVATILALRTAGVWNVPIPFLWPIVLIVVGTAFLVEWRFAARPR